MDRFTSKRVPWRSWSDFAGWAGLFFEEKGVGGFIGVAVLVGLLTSLIGTRLARETIMERARVRCSATWHCRLHSKGFAGKPGAQSSSHIGIR